MTYVALTSPFQPLVGLDGIGENAGSLYIGVAGSDPQTSPQACYWDAAGAVPATQPISVVGGYPMHSGSPAQIFTLSSYSIRLRDAAGAQVFYVASAGTDPVSQDSSLITWTQAGTGAVSRTVQAKLREVAVSITDFGGVSGLVTNNTAAFNRAVTALGTNGGEIHFPIGDWRGDFFVNQDNITLVGQGGVGELSRTCLRPWTTGAGAFAVAFSNGTRVNRKCGIRDIVISGDDGSGNQADMALALYGGTTHFSAHRFELMDGLRSLHMQPGGGYPVTCDWFSHWNIRNDVNLAGARSVYILRAAGGNYTTGIELSGGHVNKSGAGYACEIDGTAAAVTVNFWGVYWDVPVGGGVLLKGGAAVGGGGAILDPGTTGAVVMETDQLSKDITQYIKGGWDLAGQKIKFGDATTLTIPANVALYSRAPTFSFPYIVGPMSFTQVTAPYTVAGEISSDGTNLVLGDKDVAVLKNLKLYGGTATLGATLSTVGVGGGLRVDAEGTDQDCQLRPTGAGNVVLGGASTQSLGDGSATLGTGANRWTEVFAVNGVINTSDARQKTDPESIPDAWLDAWGEVEWSRFKFKAAVEKKGDGARWHVGVIAQQVVEAFARHGVDAFEIGVACFDEWDDQFEDERDEAGGLTGERVKIRDAGSAHGIRYDEAQALEAAWTRRELQRLRA